MALTKATYRMTTGAPANVLDFGAKGDGVTNDTAAIQAAIAASKSVYFPSGSYLVSGTPETAIFTLTSDSEIFGDGANSTKILVSTSARGDVFVIDTVNKVTVSDLTVDGQSFGLLANLSDRFSAFDVIDSNDITIENVRITKVLGHPNHATQSKPTNVITIDNSNNVTVNNCDFVANRSEVVYFYNTCERAMITNCRFLGDQAPYDANFGQPFGSFVSGGGTPNNLIFDNNDCRESGFTSISPNNGDGMRITNNRVYDANYAGIGVGELDMSTTKYDSQNDCIISGNIVIGSGQDGIIYTGGTNCIISNNIVSDQTAANRYGIRIGATGYSGNVTGVGIVISNNILQNNTDGLLVEFGVDVHITGNSFIENTSYGVFVASNQSSLDTVVYIRDNLFRENATGGIQFGSTATYTQVGYVENNMFSSSDPSTIQGLAIIANGSNSSINVIDNSFRGGYLLDIASSTATKGYAYYAVSSGAINPAPFALGGNYVNYGSAAPTTGTWGRGDIIFNTLPSAGGTVGFVCTSGGTPGTWKTFGTIAV